MYHGYGGKALMHSALQAITEAIWLNRFSDENLVAFMDTYTAHFDESGTYEDKQHRVLTVAGFVSSVKKWNRFETEWGAILERVGLPRGTVFHMKEFARGDGVYAQFKDQPGAKARLVSKLIQCARKNTNKAFSCTVVIRDWERINERFQLKEALGYPYPLCGMTCMGMVRAWARRNKITSPIEFFFEDGATHRGQLCTLSQRHDDTTPIFKKKAEMVQFQCCDLLAWKNRKILERTVLVGPRRDPADLASILESLREVNQIPHKYAVHHRESMERLCALAPIPKR